MLKKAKYTRIRKIVRNLEENTRVVHKSINEAKRNSRELQMSLDGALGRGSVRVIK